MTAETALIVLFACFALFFMFMYLGAERRLEGLAAENKKLALRDQEIGQLRADLSAARAAKAPEPSPMRRLDGEPDYYVNAPEPAARTLPGVQAELAALMAAKAPEPSPIRQLGGEPDCDVKAPEPPAARPLPVVRQTAKVQSETGVTPSPLSIPTTTKQDYNPTFSFGHVMNVIHDTRLDMTSAEAKMLHARLINRRGELDPKTMPSQSILSDDLSTAYRSKSLIVRTQAMLDYAHYNFTAEQVDALYACLMKDKPQLSSGYSHGRISPALVVHSGEDYWSRPRN